MSGASERRRRRLNDLLREEISELLRREVKDPRLSAFVTVTEVALSPDLKHAQVYVSVLGEAAEKEAVFQGLLAAGGFIRHELKERLDLRFIPELSFERDSSIEQGARILELLDRVSPHRGEHGPRDSEPQ